MLQIVIKHLKVSLIVYFLRRLPFLRSLLALTVIWRARIKALLTARNPDKYTELQYSRKHNLFCLKWTLGELIGKNIWCVTLYDSCITVGRLSQCYPSIKEKRESLVALHLTAFVVLIINFCNEHTEVIFTFDNLFFVGYMNAFV